MSAIIVVGHDHNKSWYIRKIIWLKQQMKIGEGLSMYFNDDL